jgi:phage tail sheath protein FI
MYFPHIRLTDPLTGQLRSFPPSGAIAGVIATTDAARGAFKAPAGTGHGRLPGVRALTVNLTDREQGLLNPIALNCLRVLPIVGPAVWGTRTLAGADEEGSPYKYVPVRRLALMLEESVFRGLKWVVFEPNDERLWGNIRLNVGAFMNTLFRQGAFQGTSAREAYFVKCDSETTTQNDINNGIVNIIIGFAPLKPAEFVVVKIEQIAGEIEV